MKEIVFINRNGQRWKDLEETLLKPGSIDPEMLSRLYYQLSDDLSYARTYFPKSTIAAYLNDLTVKVHHLIYKNRKIGKKSFMHFWKYTYPLIIRENHRYVLYAFGILIISVAIGALSSAHDPDFARFVLGDKYMNMTLENIENSDPLAVYKSANEIDMFLGITLNNIRVSFFAYLFGLLLSFGTGYILFLNGVMLGSFVQLFAQAGYLKDCLLTVFIHGTLEIFAIIVAGGAGIMLGNSLLFPDTYSRITSFRMGAAKSVKILAGLIPMFILAAFFEGFITRYTGMPDFMKASFILVSFLIIGFYFVYYPINLNKSQAIWKK